jgi:hypothetical protein
MRVDELRLGLDKAERAFARYISRAPTRKTKRHVIVITNLKTLESRIRDLLSARLAYFAASVQQTRQTLEITAGKEEILNRTAKPGELVRAMLQMQYEDYDTRLADTLLNIMLVSRIFGTSNDLAKFRAENKPFAEFMKRLSKRAKDRSGVSKDGSSTADVNTLMWSRRIKRGIL